MQEHYRRGELLSRISFRAKLDAIGFRAPREPEITKTQFKGPVYGTFGLQDPVRYQLEHPELRERPLTRVEVAIDIGPNRRTMPKVADNPTLWAMLMRQTFRLMVENLYPWDGPGIGHGPARAFGKRGTIFLDRAHAPYGHTVYFGHDEEPAMVALYHKVTDKKKAIPRLKERVRVELVLEEEGCRMLGLRTVGDLLSFEYRTALAPYFRAIRPRVRHRLFHGAPKAMREMLLGRVGRQWVAAVGEHYVAGGGSHALRGVNAADTGKNAGFEPLNREMRRALSNVIRTRP